MSYANKYAMINSKVQVIFVHTLFSMLSSNMEYKLKTPKIYLTIILVFSIT
jgi:hypothetical protein